MTNSPINPKLVQIALDNVDTQSFERFAQNFYSALVGRKFVPLGGVHDGGADGFVEPELFEDSEATHFIQISKQDDLPTKIKGTVARLLKVERKPKSLTYITSQTVPYIDQVEDALSDELGCRIRIRDAKYIESQINYSEATIAAFNAYLKPSLLYLDQPGNSPIGSSSALLSDRTLAVFLRQEVEHRRGNTDLLESVADSLIIWALSDTDPDQGRFMTRDKILQEIEKTLPTSKSFIRGVLDNRLEVLRSKTGGGNRQIRFYSNGQKYCLPFETRELVRAENIEDATIKSDVTAVLERRCLDVATDNEKGLAPMVVKICHQTLERVFESQGLQLAKFAHEGDENDELYEDVAGIVATIIDESTEIEDRLAVRKLALRVLRGTFYDGTREERLYLQKLSQTYVLMMLLKSEPKIVEYFKTISSKFILYIGTDFLIRALSEHYLAPDNQTTRNLFAILRAAGAQLILTEKAVEEVGSHLRAQILEFKHYYEFAESKVPLDAVAWIDRILIRAYFYSRLAPIAGIAPPAGFKNYIEQFGSYNDLLNRQGDEALGRYLAIKFGFEHESSADMLAGLKESDVKELTDKIIAVRAEGGQRPKDSAEILAYNDALQVLRVYQRRVSGKESSPSNPFGFKTWWLTQDVKVRRASGDVIAKHHMQRFMMRPEFLLNFVSLVPSGADVRETYKNVFPSVLGIRLSNRLQSHTFKSVMEKANEVFAVDEARSGAMIAECVNVLKGDTVKIYHHEWEESV